MWGARLRKSNARTEAKKNDGNVYKPIVGRGDNGSHIGSNRNIHARKAVQLSCINCTRKNTSLQIPCRIFANPLQPWVSQMSMRSLTCVWKSHAVSGKGASKQNAQSLKEMKQVHIKTRSHLTLGTPQPQSSWLLTTKNLHASIATIVTLAAGFPV